MAIHFNTYLGGNGNMFQYIIFVGKLIFISIPTWKEIAITFNTDLWGDCYSLQYLSRRKWRLFSIQFGVEMAMPIQEKMALILITDMGITFNTVLWGDGHSFQYLSRRTW